jgi:L-histidine N-alpha-methyltransferase
MELNYDLVNIENMGISSNQTLTLDILEGLSSQPKFIPSKYHYDEKGSLLFQQIMNLKEYYLTGCELENLKIFKNEVAKIVSDRPFRLIELGVGDGIKTKILLHHFLNLNLQFEYIPIDCCQEVVSDVITSLNKEFSDSNLKVLGITADYFHALSWLKKQTSMRNVVLFLGSNIGNFTLKEVQHFLHHIWNALKDGDYLLIGFDLKKDIATVENAYNDDLGITAEFNLNLLDRFNTELGSNFNRNKFKYHSFYNPKDGRVESWLMSTEDQTIHFPALQKDFHFDAWEGIHVENSYKYDLKNIEELARSTGFSIKHKFVDKKGYFAEVVWEVNKTPEQTQKKESIADEISIASLLSQN